ncbi:MAG: FHA domain-containing protein [Granulosicoccus sp.]|nr:FHA domain-containing protein [Granulosicoccus sp.]
MNYVLLTSDSAAQGGRKFDLAVGEKLTVGRSWNCDVVVNDMFVEAEHLIISIDEKGQLTLEDLDTLNGTRVGKRRINSKATYELGRRILIGDTELVVLSAQHEIVPALKYDSVQFAARTFSSFGWLVLMTLLAVGAMLAFEFGMTSTEFTSGSFAKSIAGYLSFAIGWCFVAGFVAMMFRGKMLFRLQWLFICSMTVVTILFAFAGELLQFNLDSAVANVIIDEASVFILSILFLFGTLSLVSRMKAGKKLIGATSFAIAFMVMSVFVPMLEPEHESWSARTGLTRTNLPPSVLVVGSVPLAEHTVQSDELFSRLEKNVSWVEPAPIESVDNYYSKSYANQYADVDNLEH